jgi:hypothetical protein
MNDKEKTALALKFLDIHEEVYGTKVPKRLRDFWKKGEAKRHDRECLPAGFAEIPGFEAGSFRLLTTVPSWGIQSEVCLDDAVVGMDGEWKGAAKTIPLFLVEQSRFLVARLDDPRCPVGLFDEESWSEDGDGYQDGVFMIARSLDELLEALVSQKKADFEAEKDRIEMAWEAVKALLADAASAEDDPP